MAIFGTFAYGKSLPQKDRDSYGSIPVYGSNGIVGFQDVSWTQGPTVIVGRKGAGCGGRLGAGVGESAPAVSGTVDGYDCASGDSEVVAGGDAGEAGGRGRGGVVGEIMASQT